MHFKVSIFFIYNLFIMYAYFDRPVLYIPAFHPMTAGMGFSTPATLSRRKRWLINGWIINRFINKFK